MIYILLADGFEEMEALVPCDILRRADLDVLLVSIGSRKEVTGAHNIKVLADILISDANFEGMEMIILPGGARGTENLQNSRDVQRLIDFCVLSDTYIAAICAAPSILGRRGLLNGKKAVCFPDFQGELTGAALSDKNVCIDGKIVTAKSAGFSDEFAFAIVRLIAGDEAEKKIRAVMRCT